MRKCYLKWKKRFLLVICYKRHDNFFLRGYSWFLEGNWISIPFTVSFSPVKITDISHGRICFCSTWALLNIYLKWNIIQLYRDIEHLMLYINIYVCLNVLWWYNCLYILNTKYSDQKHAYYISLFKTHDIKNKSLSKFINEIINSHIYY